MKRATIVLKPIVVAVSALFAGTALAGVPSGVSVKTSHPRLYASAFDFTRLEIEAAVGPKTFPTQKGELKFTLTPVPKGTGDTATTTIFGDQNAPNSLYVRHADSGTSAGRTLVQVVLQRTARVGTTEPINAFAATFEVTTGTPHEFVVTWDAGAKTAVLKVDNVQHPAKWQTAGDGWTASGQKFVLGGHKGDQLKNLSVRNLATNEVWSSLPELPVEIALHESWQGYLRRSTTLANLINNTCDLSKPLADQVDYCNTTKGGRGKITEPAKWLALAYRLTGKPELLTAAKKHIKLLLKADLGAGEVDGPEWSMGGRVGAMGIYYDWLFDDLKGDSPDGVLTYHEALAQRIKATIAFDVVGKNTDLLGSVCGAPAQNASGQWVTPTITANPFDCAVKPVFTTGAGPNIRTNYLSGHTASANTGSLLGLLAIADAYPEVKGLIDTIYDHFKFGYLRARDFVAENGGNQTLYSYASSAGETADRLLLWNRALTSNSGLQMVSAPYMIYPYIYGVRADGSFPAGGDNFTFSLGERSVGSMALVGAAAGDVHAANYYWNDIMRYRSASHVGLFEERLLYPKPTTAAPTTALPLSRHFKTAGNVLMRDTWTHAEATLLDFKSSSFISENHHHLDQNAFSLSYKAPLLLDSGRYDNYGSVHWLNYYTRTIAHNTITVYDEETFGGRSLDGGQWFGTRATYPTIEQIQPGGSNVLDGVASYEEGGDYAYVTGNASKAYVNSKIDPNTGFLRSIVYLRSQVRGEQPKILVFDSVRPTKPNMEITSLLHSVNKPTSTIVPTDEHNGRYKFGFIGAAEPLTIRNGDGMVTVQPLLPAQSDIALVGGLNEGSSCVQAAVPGTTSFETPRAEFTSQDCRFMVRTKLQDGTIGWRNFALMDEPPEPSRDTDIGAWRVEITPRTAPAVGTAQFFLNVLHVDDSDGATSGAAAIAKARLLSSDGNAVAVAMADGRVVVFHGGVAPSATTDEISWTVDAGSKAPTLVVGLQKGATYTLTPVSTTRMKLTRSSTGTLTAPNGVLKINRS
ncbi:heparinase II/III domain-containing protein [Cystobacter fuscus]